MSEGDVVNTSEEVQENQEVVEESIAPVKSVKNVEAAPPNLFDIFKPKDAANADKDGAKPEDKPADGTKPADETKPADGTTEAKPNIFDVFKPKTEAVTKPEEPKPLFPANDPFNFKKNAEEAQKAFKEKGLGGWIATVQKNVQNQMTELSVAPEINRLKDKEWPELFQAYVGSLFKIAFALPGILIMRAHNDRVRKDWEKIFPPIKPKAKK